MRQFLRINLLLSSILLFFSCASYSDGFVEKENAIQSFTPGYLTDFQEHSFKISIEAYGKHFGGILVAKKLDVNHFRFAFLNEFGGKMMDFELINRKMKLNDAIDELKRKIILKMLETDFSLLFSEENEIEKTFSYSDWTILKAKQEIQNKSVYYQLNADEILRKITLANAKEKVSVELKEIENSFPEIEISHGKQPIKIYLHLLANN